MWKWAKLKDSRPQGVLWIQDKPQQEHNRRRGCFQLRRLTASRGGLLEEGAFQLDLEKQVHYAHVELREETLWRGAGGRAGQRCGEDGSIQNKCSMVHLHAQQIIYAGNRRYMKRE